MNKFRREIVKAMKCGKTVRRRHNEDYRNHVNRYGWWWYELMRYGTDTAQQDYDKETREVFQDNLWLNKAPNWWTKVDFVWPERREAKRLAKKVLMLVDLEDAPIFPNGTRLQDGYW